MSVALIGRDEELQRLGHFLEAVPQGARALVVEGEAGAGKTSLLRGALARASDGGALALTSRPAEAEASFAYAALGDLIRKHHDAWTQLPDPQRRALEIALLLADQEGGSPDQQVVAMAALGVLRALAGRAPLVVAVDDVQWLDAPSAAVLRFVARRLGDDPIGLLLAQRTPAIEQPPLGLSQALAADRLDRVAGVAAEPGRRAETVAGTARVHAVATRPPSHPRAVWREPVFRARARPGGPSRDTHSSSPARGFRPRWRSSWGRGLRASRQPLSARSRQPPRWPTPPWTS